MNKSADYEFTVIVPVYNEEDNMPQLEKRLSEFLLRSIKKTMVLFVDDGSKDNSLSLIKEICNRNEDFHYLALSRNSGLSAAMKAGID